MLELIKEQVLAANKALETHRLVILTWGNVSAYDEETKLVVIKPSGIAYSDLKVSDMIVVDLSGKVIEGNLNPSSDTLTHIEIYKNFSGVKSIVHTHSKWATICAQARKEIKPLGTTHADYFSQQIPVTRQMTEVEILDQYEKNTGTVIVETFQKNGINPLECPAVLVSEHGPFVWGVSTQDAIQNAVVLEYVAEMAIFTSLVRNDKDPMQQTLLEKHFHRKHGINAYYGQK
jgi:L-ribulose-5-phosphate 4-epimerase